MKNNVSRENCDYKAWWISTLSFNYYTDTVLENLVDSPNLQSNLGPVRPEIFPVLLDLIFCLRSPYISFVL